MTTQQKAQLLGVPTAKVLTASSYDPGPRRPSHLGDVRLLLLLHLPRLLLCVRVGLGGGALRLAVPQLGYVVPAARCTAPYKIERTTAMSSPAVPLAQTTSLRVKASFNSAKDCHVAAMADAQS